MPIDSENPYKHPPPVYIDSTKPLDRDVLKKLGGQDSNPDFDGPGFYRFAFVPAQEHHSRLAGETAIRPKRFSDFENGTWIGLTTIAADAFRIQNGLMSVEAFLQRLKREVLLFDRLAIYDLVGSLIVIEDSYLREQLEWLSQSDFIFQPEVYDEAISSISSEYQFLIKSQSFEFVRGHAAFGTIAEYAFDRESPRIDNLLEQVNAEIADNLRWWLVRAASLWFQEVEAVRTIPVLSTRPQSPLISRPEALQSIPPKIRDLALMNVPQRALVSLGIPEAEYTEPSDVIRIVLNNFPIPGPNCAWEDLLNYKNDPTTKRHLFALRSWANETAKLAIAPSEIADKIQYLMEEYRNHLGLHRLKFSAGKTEMYLTSAAMMLDGLLHFKFTEATKRVFDLKRERIDLLKAEVESPGSELAYIVRSAERFSE